MTSLLTLPKVLAMSCTYDRIQNTLNCRQKAWWFTCEQVSSSPCNFPLLGPETLQYGQQGGSFYELRYFILNRD
jgi:hypothetical protein